jgi:AraC-like DNA-binding protein
MRDVAVKAARFLAEHASEPIALTDVADHVGYSPFHLARTFERQVGVPPGQYLAAHRFQRAKELLLAGDEPVIDICFAVGFSSVGTFTRRFVTAVGLSPTEFRRLPDAMVTSPPQPVNIPGHARHGGVVAGSVHISAAACAALGEAATIYVGLFPRRAARGFPVSGSLLGETREFLLTDVPQGAYWLLATALPVRDGPCAQLVPARSVVGACPSPIYISPNAAWHHRDVSLDLAVDWAAPVVVALPSLASGHAQDWRRHRWQGAPSLGTEREGRAG